MRTRTHPPAREHLPDQGLRGRDPITKREKYIYETAPDQASAERRRDELLALMDEESDPETRATVRTLLARWMELGDHELTTVDGYQGYIDVSIQI